MVDRAASDLNLARSPIPRPPISREISHLSANRFSEMLDRRNGADADPG